MAAQACGTPVSTTLLPGITAQPPFSTYAACCHEFGLFQLYEIVGGVGGALELIDADRRYRRDHGATGGAVRQGLRGASKHPPAPAETDDESCDDADGGAL